MEIVPPAGPGDPRWLSLRQSLWPQQESVHLREMKDAQSRRHYVRLALSPSGAAMGFIEAAKRTDYVNGTSTSPVAFVEGLYVEPASRRQGVARALVAAVERWAAAEMCTELASDSLLDNVAAHAAHAALGFEETERVVYFRRPIRAVRGGGS